MIDLFSRLIVGWAMAQHMRAELVVEALQVGLQRRRPARGLIHHSDQGSQYVALAFGQEARDARIAQSMGSKGDCYDNAVAESFFATFKKERVHRQPWPDARRGAQRHLRVTENCAETLFGRELCGDELVAFCKERYDRQINADTCDPVLRDAGIDPEEMLAERRRRRAERRRARIEAARIPAKLGEPGRVAGVEYVVQSVTEVSSLAGAYGTVIEPRGGNKLVIVNLIYRNVGRKPTDLFCGGAPGFALIDVQGRQFSPDDEAMFESIANEEACAEELQPGSEDDASHFRDSCRRRAARIAHLERR